MSVDDISGSGIALTPNGRVSGTGRIAGTLRNVSESCLYYSKWEKNFWNIMFVMWVAVSNSVDKNNLSDTHFWSLIDFLVDLPHWLSRVCKERISRQSRYLSAFVSDSCTRLLSRFRMFKMRRMKNRCRFHQSNVRWMSVFYLQISLELIRECTWISSIYEAKNCFRQRFFLHKYQINLSLSFYRQLLRQQTRTGKIHPISNRETTSSTMRETKLIYGLSFTSTDAVPV